MSEPNKNTLHHTGSDDDSATRSARTPGVDSARRVLNTLLLFERHPSLTVEEIATTIGASIPSAYRYVSLLRELSLVAEAGSGHYVLSTRLLSLSQSIDVSAHLAIAAEPVLRKLSEVTGETSLVIERAGDYATCVAINQSDTSIRISYSPRQILPLHRGAGARILLASMGRDWIERYLARIDLSLPAEERSNLLEELDQQLKSEYVVSLGELDDGVCAVAAPIILGGRIVSAITVAGPQYRMGPAVLEKIGNDVRQAAAELSSRLGNTSENSRDDSV